MGMATVEAAYACAKAATVGSTAMSTVECTARADQMAVARVKTRDIVEVIARSIAATATVGTVNAHRMAHASAAMDTQATDATPP